MVVVKWWKPHRVRLRWCSTLMKYVGGAHVSAVMTIPNLRPAAEKIMFLKHHGGNGV